jgi:protoporphyrin/coproporphyrin ferrochelatase
MTKGRRPVYLTADLPRPIDKRMTTQDAPPPETAKLTVENPSGPGGRTGVLLVNLGTPDATDYWSMRRYLKEFLSDPRVIETNRVVWWFVLNFIVLTTRPQAKGRDYDKIWNRERNESPLKTITRAQAEKLAAHFAGIDSRVLVEWAMRYGNPSLESRIRDLVAAGCEKILILPLYPQYAAATTATVCDKAFEALAKMRWQPAVRVAPPYYDDPVYIDALADSIEQDLAKLAWKPDVILASFHGIPVDYVLAGDPYESHCAETTRLLRDRMKLDGSQLRMTFQSRFGRTEWIKPYTDETVGALAKEGVKNLAIVTPGFAADCLETLEEIAGENAEIFHHNGGKNFRAIPCLNDSDGGMQVIRNVVERELKGWV